MPNAFGFIGVGAVMQVLRFLPEVSGVRELWLLVMGMVLVLIGGAVVARAGWAWFAPRMVSPMFAAWEVREVSEVREVPEGAVIDHSA